ncbi:uncharacterized protein LOC129599152 [Paramacrobiotus metropolitanus]|uniref:uncharacterized protein LOC129599152 n=1 Tax=Paramacrobiotus metropolitanus TaxID=2943436 RepID=UPI0024462743|nr:uncharacterized protein LOC129599152 [Paramacrobiotus metropolitanus]
MLNTTLRRRCLCLQSGRREVANQSQSKSSVCSRYQRSGRWLSGSSSEGRLIPQERWLYSAIADDTVDARTNLLHKLNKSAVPFDVEATFTAFYQYCREQVDMANIVLSPEALERYLELSQEIDQMKKCRRENILGRNAAYTIPASSKEEEMTLKVTLVLHLLENAIISFTATGIIDIPEEVTLETIERAIRYVRTSNNVLRTFNNENIAATKEAEMLLIPGKLLIPQIVSEATRGKNRYSFAEPKMFIKLAKDLERQGLGQIRDVQYRKNENSAVRTAIVYFKSPPSDTLAVILGTHGVTVADYAEAYDADYNLRPSLKDNLGHIARILEQQSPFSSVTDEHDTENEGSVFSANGENESEYSEDANSGGSVGSDEMVVNGNEVVVNGDSESDVVDVTDGKPEDYQEEEDEDSDSEDDGIYQQQTKKQKFAPTA